MAATTDGNQNYRRHNQDNIEVVPQPLTTNGTDDPGDGWESKPYLNFNGNYTRYGNTPGDDSVPQPTPNGGDYVRYSNTPGVPAPPPEPYERN